MNTNNIINNGSSQNNYLNKSPSILKHKTENNIENHPHQNNQITNNYQSHTNNRNPTNTTNSHTKFPSERPSSANPINKINKNQEYTSNSNNLYNYSSSNQNVNNNEINSTKYRTDVINDNIPKTGNNVNSTGHVRFANQNNKEDYSARPTVQYNNRNEDFYDSEQKEIKIENYYANKQNSSTKVNFDKQEKIEKVGVDNKTQSQRDQRETKITQNERPVQNNYNFNPNMANVAGINPSLNRPNSSNKHVNSYSLIHNEKTNVKNQTNVQRNNYDKTTNEGKFSYI